MISIGDNMVKKITPKKRTVNPESALATRLRKGQKVVYTDRIGRKRGEGAFVEYRDHGFTCVIKDKNGAQKLYFATQVLRKNPVKKLEK